MKDEGWKFTSKRNDDDALRTDESEALAYAPVHGSPIASAPARGAQASLSTAIYSVFAVMTKSSTPLLKSTRRKPTSRRAC